MKIPPPPPHFSDITCGTDELVGKLQADPPSLNGCSAASIRGADMPALVGAGATKEQLLAVWSLDGATGFTPAQLLSAGVTVAEMREADLTISQIHAGGVSVLDLRTAGVSIDDLRSAGVGIADLLGAGVSVADLISTGVTILELRSAGVSVADLQNAGLTPLQLYSGGISPAQLHSAGVSVAQMLSAGLSISQIHAGGVSIPDLRMAEISIAELRSIGVTTHELYSGGFTIAQMLSASLTIPELYAGGVRGVPGYALFNEACNTPPRSSGTSPSPIITVTRLTVRSEGVELRAAVNMNAQWLLDDLLGTGMDLSIISSENENTVRTVGTVTGRYVMFDGTILVSDLIIPFSLAFSNLRAMVTVFDSQARSTMIRLCPGSGS